MSFLILICLLNPFNEFLSKFKEYKLSSNETYFCQDHDYGKIPLEFHKFISIGPLYRDSQLIYGGLFIYKGKEIVVFEQYFPDGKKRFAPDGSFIFLGLVDRSNSKITNIIKIAEDHLSEAYNLILSEDKIKVRIYNLCCGQKKFSDPPADKAKMSEYILVVGNNSKFALKKNSLSRVVSYFFNDKLCEFGLFILK